MMYNVWHVILDVEHCARFLCYVCMKISTWSLQYKCTERNRHVVYKMWISFLVKSHRVRFDYLFISDLQWIKINNSIVVRPNVDQLLKYSISLKIGHSTDDHVVRVKAVQWRISLGFPRKYGWNNRLFRNYDLISFSKHIYFNCNTNTYLNPISFTFSSKSHNLHKRY